MHVTLRDAEDTPVVSQLLGLKSPPPLSALVALSEPSHRETRQTYPTEKNTNTQKKHLKHAAEAEHRAVCVIKQS